jgi:hypothetical protein
MRSCLAIVSTLLALAAAQTSGDIGLGLAAIEAHFNQSHIVPDLLPSFQPKALLGVNYGESNNAELGMNRLKPRCRCG